MRKDGIGGWIDRIRIKKSNEASLLSVSILKKTVIHILGIFFLCLIMVPFMQSSNIEAYQDTALVGAKKTVNDPACSSQPFTSDIDFDYEIITLSHENTEAPLRSESTPPPSFPITTPQVPLAPLPLPNAPAMVYTTPHAEILETSFRDYMISRGSHDVAITIDDGPSQNTPALLQVLAEEGAQATFFVLGNRVKVFPEYARQIVDEGHEIANHSWSHFSLENGKPPSYGIWQFQYAQQVIQETTGVTGHLLIRIPYGKVYSSLIRTMGRDGYRFITWSIDTKDWAYHDDEHTLCICSNAGPGDIILIHSQATSADTLRAMIRMLKDKGLSCITVSQMMGMSMPEKPFDGDEVELSYP